MNEKDREDMNEDLEKAANFFMKIFDASPWPVKIILTTIFCALIGVAFLIFMQFVPVVI